MSIQHDKLEQEYEQEYHTRIYFWYTQFKNRYSPVKGFSPYAFKGTEKEYNDITSIYFKNEESGKVIGVEKFDTIEQLTNYTNKAR